MNRFALQLFTACCVVGVSAVSLGKEGLDNASPELSLYHADPTHLWNRLHKTLFVRVGPDRRAYGQDRLEPLLWPQSKHLLAGRSHKRALDLLREFLDSNGENLIEDPMKRALLQRDLWMVLDWLESDHRGFVEPQLKAEEVSAAQDRLRKPLVKIIGRLALRPNEIRDLGDNYAAAAASGEFALSFDRKHPHKPYLPADLFQADGPWLCVGRTDGVTAPRHLADDYNRFTNSVFFVFLRLPAGRAATSAYLKKLFVSKEPILISNPKSFGRRPYLFLPNPKLPQFPRGTELALVRRALLIDSSHRLTASPLTESVQTRVIHGDASGLLKQLRADPERYFNRARKEVGEWQYFQEFRLRRGKLFAGRAGGLHAATDQLDFKTGFRAHPWDEFEQVLRPDQLFVKMTQRPVKQNCFACHNLPGVFSFNSFRTDVRFALQREDGGEERALPLSEMAVSDVAQATVEWKESRPRWIALRKLLAE